MEKGIANNKEFETSSFNVTVRAPKNTPEHMLKLYLIDRLDTEPAMSRVPITVVEVRKIKI